MKNLFIVGVLVFTGFLNFNLYGQSVGQTFTDGTFNYKIISLSPNKVQIGDGSTAFGIVGGSAQYNGTMPTIPSQVTGGTGNLTYSVTKIGDYAFNQASDVTGALVIPASIDTIGEYAFQDAGITSLSFSGTNLKYIGARAFYFCESLTGALVIPASIDTIRQYTFYHTAITSLSFANSSILKSINMFAFSNCTNLSGTINIPEGVTAIDIGAFSGCPSITSVIIPSTINVINSNAFYGCSGLQSITIKCTTPPSIMTSVFAAVPTTIPVYVPCSAINAYQNAYVWSSFTNIQPILSGLTALGGGPGTSWDNAYTISTEEQLRYWSSNYSTYLYKYIILTDDINMSCGGFTPIPDFQGHFDGQEHAIIHITVNGSTSVSGGLFNQLNYAEVKNVGLMDVNVTSTNGSYIGGFVGRSAYSTITRCYVDAGNVTSTGRGEGFGGFVGWTVGSGGNPNIINECHTWEVDVTALGRTDGFTAVGGFAGYMNSGSGIIMNCFSRGAVTGTATACYGDCYGNAVGVFFGADNSSTYVYNCYARGTVTGISANGFGMNNNGHKYNCFSTCTVNRNTACGGSGAFTSSCTGVVQDCYYLDTWQGTDGSGTNWAGASTIGTEVTSAEMMDPDFIDLINNNADLYAAITGTSEPYYYEAMDVNDGYPILYWQCPYALGEGECNPYRIYTIAELRQLSAEVAAGDTKANKYYKLMNDLTFEDTDLIYDFDNDGINESNFNPIGGFDALNPQSYATDFSFNGNFNGGGHVINGLKIIVRNTTVRLNNSLALFGRCDGYFSIKKLGLSNATIEGTSASAGLVAACYGYANIEKCYIVNSTITGNTNMGIFIGVLAGLTDNNIKKCFARDVSLKGGVNTGGLIGVVFSTEGVTIENCYVNKCKIFGNSNVGGLIGLFGNFSTGTGTINRCYANTSVSRSSGINSNFGGLVGQQNSSNTITDSYYNDDWSPQGLAGNAYGTVEPPAYIRAFGGLRDALQLNAAANTWFEDEPTSWNGSVWLRNYGNPVLKIEPVMDPYRIKNGEIVKVAAGYNPTGENPDNIIIEEGGSLINNDRANKKYVAQMEYHVVNEGYNYLSNPFVDGNDVSIKVGDLLGCEGGAAVNHYTSFEQDLDGDGDDDLDFVSMLKFNYQSNMWQDGYGHYIYLGYGDTAAAGQGYFTYGGDVAYNTADTVGRIFKNRLFIHKDTLFNAISYDVVLNNAGDNLLTVEEPNIEGLWYSVGNPYPGVIYTEVFDSVNRADIPTDSTFTSVNDIYTFLSDQTFSTSVPEKINGMEGFFVRGFEHIQ
jgi:hypothetical protein